MWSRWCYSIFINSPNCNLVSEAFDTETNQNVLRKSQNSIPDCLLKTPSCYKYYCIWRIALAWRCYSAKHWAVQRVAQKRILWLEQKWENVTNGAVPWSSQALFLCLSWPIHPWQNHHLCCQESFLWSDGDLCLRRLNFPLWYLHHGAPDPSPGVEGAPGQISPGLPLWLDPLAPRPDDQLHPGPPQVQGTLCECDKPSLEHHFVLLSAPVPASVVIRRVTILW